MMKKIVIFLLLTCSLFSKESVKSGHAFALVHIGDELPAYLKWTVHQIRLFNEKSPIYLVASQQALEKENTAFWKANLILVPYESLKVTTEHDQFKKALEKKREYYQGFVGHTTERFYYLYDLMAEFQLKNVLHLENDVLIYTEVNKILPILERDYPGMGVTFDNDQRGIAGLMFIKKKEALRDFLRFINRYEHRRLDMELLSIYRKKSNDKKIKALPVLMEGYHQTNPLKSKTPELYSQGYSDFNSIFDAAALGQYLGGQDPKNGPCERGFVNPHCIFDVSTLDADFEVDEKGRKVPFAIFNGKKVRINNLHIHSKHLQNHISLP